MKKAKKYIAVLSSVVVMASCAVSNVFAVGTDNNSDDVSVSSGTSEKITDPNEIVKLLKDYAEKENRFIINGVSLASDDEGYDVIVNIYFNKHEKHETIIRDYMKENNIDDSRVSILVYDFCYPLLGDVNQDDRLTVRDAAYIAKMIAQGKADELPEQADYNNDDIVNVRDTAAMARELAQKIK